MKKVLVLVVHASLGACTGLVTATVACSAAANTVRWFVFRKNKK